MKQNQSEATATNATSPWLPIHDLTNHVYAGAMEDVIKDILQLQKDAYVFFEWFDGVDPHKHADHCAPRILRNLVFEKVKTQDKFLYYGLCLVILY